MASEMKTTSNTGGLLKLNGKEYQLAEAVFCPVSRRIDSNGKPISTVDIDLPTLTLVGLDDKEIKELQKLVGKVDAITGELRANKVSASDADIVVKLDQAYVTSVYVYNQDTIQLILAAGKITMGELVCTKPWFSGK